MRRGFLINIKDMRLRIIYGVVHNWCKTNYKGHCKIFQTPGSNDNGKDIILESDCSLNGFLGMSFQKQGKKVLKIYIECKSSDSNKIPYNSLAGNIKLSELDNITHYVLVTKLPCPHTWHYHK